LPTRQIASSVMDIKEGIVRQSPQAPLFQRHRAPVA